MNLVFFYQKEVFLVIYLKTRATLMPEQIKNMQKTDRNGIKQTDILTNKVKLSC
ncbi:hypothetical protein LY11_00506 [Pedobacter cryoconitis]|uniref:Uncharacterized protein n=1 Tax=Pedobacter cryoconitis TaxID=188932 RepID=A0A327T8A3_9SPHI|nr:hypothetical protein LY11_00506 [Pedobacter cryoconitis]